MKKCRYILIALTVSSLSLQGCEDFLEEEVFSQLAPVNFLPTPEGIESVLYAAYATAANMTGNNSVYVIGPQEFATDILFQSGDGDEPTVALYRNFNVHPGINYLTLNYDPPYQTIRNANILLENLDLAQITEEQKTLYIAEARFLRAISYYKLYFMFGPVSLRTSSADELQLPRASDEEMRSFIESELLAVITDLPASGSEAAYGRAHNGAARAFLSKFYLQTHQWQKAADMAKEVIDMGHFGLFHTYQDLFKVENEQNQEYIWVRPAKPSTDRRTANSWMNVSFPPDFALEPKSGLTFRNTWLNWPNEFRIYDAFLNSFELGDARKDLIITEYIDKSGKTVSLAQGDQARSFKFWPDPDATGAAHGNDIPEIRYADILLARAEALNELSGPNQESLDLINQVRSRAKLDAKSLVDFSSKESLRDHILRERGWEFYSEGHRRLDLIRMGKYISSAHERGHTNAQPYHSLFPIPQVAINANPKLVQNEGY